MWKDLSLKALSPGPAVVLPRGGLHKCPRAQQGPSTAETLLLKNSEHNHGRGSENKRESRFPLPVHAPSRTGGDTGAR